MAMRLRQGSVRRTGGAAQLVVSRTVRCRVPRPCAPYRPSTRTAASADTQGLEAPAAPEPPRTPAPAPEPQPPLDPEALAPAPEPPQSYVSAPLVLKGAGTARYLTLALRFPEAATSGQRRRGESGVSLDFILDNGSTVNVLNPLVARELALPVVGMQPAGAGAGGGIASAPIFLLGGAQLDHLSVEQRFTFMTGLQAAGLAVPSPACSGILGRAFIDSFAAVELRFAADAGAAGDAGRDASDAGAGAAAASQGTEVADAASASASGGGGGGGYEIRFHADSSFLAASGGAGLRQVPVSLLGVSGLWGVQLQVAGPGGERLVVPALVDTGSPVTVLNTAAAAALGLLRAAAPPPPPGGGLLGGLARMLGLGPSGVSVGGVAARQAEAGVQVAVEAEGGDRLELGTVRPLVGDLPGFLVLGVQQGQPGAILGLDVLTTRPGLVLYPKETTLWM